MNDHPTECLDMLLLQCPEAFILLRKPAISNTQNLCLLLMKTSRRLMNIISLRTLRGCYCLLNVQILILSPERSSSFLEVLPNPHHSRLVKDYQRECQKRLIFYITIRDFTFGRRLTTDSSKFHTKITLRESCSYF